MLREVVYGDVFIVLLLCTQNVHTIWIRELFCMMRRLGSLKCILLNYRDGLIGGYILIPFFSLQVILHLFVINT